MIWLRAVIGLHRTILTMGKGTLGVDIAESTESTRLFAPKMIQIFFPTSDVSQCG